MQHLGHRTDDEKVGVKKGSKRGRFRVGFGRFFRRLGRLNVGPAKSWAKTPVRNFFFSDVAERREMSYPRASLAKRTHRRLDPSELVPIDSVVKTS